MRRLRATVIGNGVAGFGGGFEVLDSDSDIAVETQEVGPGFKLFIEGYDLIIVPNGSDHVAMHRNAAMVRRHLDRGGALFCFDGWVTPWIPGNAWVMDNSKPSREMRYRTAAPGHPLLEGVDLEALSTYHGVQGWWACGYIDPAPGAEVLLEDSWGRAVLVLDAATTPGTMALTASGPLGEWKCESPTGVAVSRLYRNLIAFTRSRP